MLAPTERWLAACPTSVPRVPFLLTNSVVEIHILGVTQDSAHERLMRGITAPSPAGVLNDPSQTSAIHNVMSHAPSTGWRFPTMRKCNLCLPLSLLCPIAFLPFPILPYLTLNEQRNSHCHCWHGHSSIGCSAMVCEWLSSRIVGGLVCGLERYHHNCFLGSS